MLSYFICMLYYAISAEEYLDSPWSLLAYSTLANVTFVHYNDKTANTNKAAATRPYV